MSPLIFLSKQTQPDFQASSEPGTFHYDTDSRGPVAPVLLKLQPQFAGFLKIISTKLRLNRSTSTIISTCLKELE